MFQQHTPPWVLLGGAALAACAGFINAVGVLGLHHQSLTHLTGTISITSIHAAQGEGLAALRALLVVLSFFGGCVLSGFIIQQTSLRLGRRYGFALILESLLLGSAVFFLQRGAFAGDYLASAACGLQNAMATSYSGAVIRTTHFTGIITDLGIALGQLARGQRSNFQRIRLYLILLGGFAAGGAVGGVAYSKYHYSALLLPAALVGFAGISYSILKQIERSRRG